MKTVKKTKQEEKPLILDTDETVEVKKTKNYSMFKTIVGNRDIYDGHVANLTKWIAKKNMLAQNPILVNKNMEVIDGQHRLEVAKANNLTIYYIVDGDASLSEVQALNSSSKWWTGRDYLESYAKQGKEAYIFIKEYVDKGINLSNVLAGGILRSMRYKSRWRDFKSGQLVMSPEQKEVMRLLLDAYLEVKPYCVYRAWSDREFVSAFIKLMQNISVSELIQKLVAYGEKIDHRDSTKEYLREFEEIVNYRMKKDYQRLF